MLFELPALLRFIGGGRSLDDARQKLEAWRVEYTEERSHSSLGNLLSTRRRIKPLTQATRQRTRR